MTVYKMAGLCHVSHLSFNDSDGSERSPMMTTSPSGHWPSVQSASTTSSVNVCVGGGLQTLWGPNIQNILNNVLLKI